MYKLKILDIKEFKKELAKLKEEYIILFESDGYYRPNTEKEYLDFICKQIDTIKALNKTIEIAKKEMSIYRKNGSCV